MMGNNYRGRIEVLTDSGLKPGTLTLLVHPSEGEYICELLKAGVILKVNPQTVDGLAINDHQLKGDNGKSIQRP